MTELMREAVPIIFMFACVLALGPFIGLAMWMAFDGDRLREPALGTAAPVDVRGLDASPVPRTAAEVTSAA